jgi:hypothetical protein
MATDRETLKVSYAQSFGGLGGERVLKDLQSKFWQDTEMFLPGDSSEALLFREGQRSVMLYINRMMKEGKTRA